MDPFPPAAAGKSYWRFSKEDFFPEPSFDTLETYLSALSETPRRLKDRLLARSSDSNELFRSKYLSENEMRRCLTWWDLIWLCFGSVVGSGIFSINGQETHDDAGPAIVLSYALSGLSALLSVFCYTEFSVEIPIAGGSFSFLRVELGDFVAFIAAGNILLQGLGAAASLGRSWSSYLASMIKSDPDSLRFKIDSFEDEFNLLDPLAVVVLIVVNGIAMTGTKHSSILNMVSSIFRAAVIMFIIIFGFVYGKSENLMPFFPYGAEGVSKAAAVVYWSYTGFDMVANMAEEVKNPARDIPIGLVGSMSLITVVYCLMALVLAMMVKYTEVDVNAAYSVVFDQHDGFKWAKYLISIVALKGMATSMLVGSMGQARYTTQIARAHMIPPFFALVHPRTGTPIYATLLITAGGCILAFFWSLDVLLGVYSFSTLFIFMLMAVALLVRRYYVKDVTPRQDVIKLMVSLVIVFVASLGMTVLWSSRKSWAGHVLFGVLWGLGTLGMALTSKHRVPKVWGVPLVPWLPSLSIGMNIFLMGSLGTAAAGRFLICSMTMLVYYVFAGVHATYDVRHVYLEEGNN